MDDDDWALTAALMILEERRRQGVVADNQAENKGSTVGASVLAWCISVILGLFFLIFII